MTATAGAGPSCVAYYRVSTAKQGRSGLGLEAQRAAVGQLVASRGGRLVGEFVEVESGRRADRPQLAAALAACRAYRATLMIAKLDRLARNVHFVSGLMESKVDFVAADLPSVTKFTLHILAALAEEEARMISARTKAALSAAKARGVRLGNPRLLAGDAAGARRAAAAKSAMAHARASNLAPIIAEIRGAGIKSHAGIARALTARGVPTLSGRGGWHGAQVARAERRSDRNRADGKG